MNAQHVRAIARKEVWHLLRDPRSLALILLMPSLLLFLFGYAIRLDLYEAPIAIIQQSRDAATEELVARFAASRAFNVVLRSNDRRDAAAALQKGQVWAALIFPRLRPAIGVRQRPAAIAAGRSKIANTARVVAHYTWRW